MRFEVLLSVGAASDFNDVLDYIAKYDSPEKARHVRERILEVLAGLERLPNRGTRPRELMRLGIAEYREVFFKPYRIIYQVMNRRVFVLLIADGRRDMQTLLMRRMVRLMP